MSKKKVYGFGNVFEDTKKKKEVDRRAAAASRGEPERKENAAKATLGVSSKSVPVQQRDIVTQAAKEAVEKQAAAERTAKLQKVDMGLFSPQMMAKAKATMGQPTVNGYVRRDGGLHTENIDYQQIINKARQEDDKRKEALAKEARFIKIYGNPGQFGQYADKGDYTPNALNEAALQLYENRKNQRVAELAKENTLRELQLMEAKNRYAKAFQMMDSAQADREYELMQEARKLKTNLYDESLRLGFEDLRNAPDFNEKSIPNVNKKLDDVNKIIYADKSAREALHNAYYNGGEYPEMLNKKILGPIVWQERLDFDKYKLMTMRNDERQLYSYIANTQGEKAAREYLKSIDKELNARLAVRGKQQSEQLARRAPKIASVMSAAEAPVAAITGTAQMIKDAAMQQMTGRLESADINSAGYRNVRSRENVRNEVSRHMNDTQKFFYDVGMSMGDMLAAMPFGPTGAAAIMGSGAAAATAYEAGKRGLSATEAAKLGIASGVIETVTEKIGFDRLTDIMKLSKGGIKGALKGAFKQSIPEGFEEITSGFLNHLAEQAILGEKSQYNESIRNYIESGMDRRQAEKRARGDLIKEFLLSGGAGLLSGAVFGGGAGGLGMLVDTGDTKIGASHTAVKNNNAIRENGLTPVDDMIPQKETDVRDEVQDDRTERYKITFSNDGIKEKSNAIIQKVKQNFDKIKKQQIFSVESDRDISAYSKKSDYIFDIFKKQGNIAHNPQIGNVELTKAGAKSTISHGFGETKLAAAKAIKSVIENGDIVSFDKNYNNNGVDRYIIAAEGKINGKDALVGVVIKSYPDSGHDNKFYLHEAEIIEGTASSFLTAPQLSVDTVNEAIPSEDRIPQKETDVKRENEEGTTEAENIAAEIGIDKSVPNRQETKKRTGVRATVAAERMRRARPKYFSVLNGISKKLSIETVIDEDIESADGYYDKTTGELHINLNAQNPLKVIVKHELTHVLEDNNKAYDDMVSFVKTELEEEWNSKYSEIQSRYERINKRRTEKGLEIVEFDEYEVMAELAEQFDTDDFIEKVSGVNRPMAERIRDFIREAIKKIKAAFGNTKELSKWEQAEAKWNKALEAATKTDRSSEGIRYLLSEENSKSIKEQLKDNANKLNSMVAVSKTEYKERGLTKAQVLKRVSERFKKLGYSVERKDFGRIEISEKLINTSLNYLNSEAEFAAFDAIDKVLKHGIEIEERDNHKKREHGTVTFAAPVEINGMRGNVAVIVKETKGHRYKTHRILMPDGSAFVLNEKTEATTDWMTANNGGESQSITSAINNRIPQKETVVNSNNMQKSEKDVKYKLTEPEVDRDEKRGYTKKYISKADVPYNELRQLEEYIISRNNRGDLKKLGYKEVGNNFYIWENRGKNDFEIVNSIEIDGNEDEINHLRSELSGINKREKGIFDILEAFDGRYGSGSSGSTIDKELRAGEGDVSLHQKQSGGDGRRNSGKGSGDTAEGVRYKLQDVEEQTLAEYIIDIESENNSLKEINQTLREHIKSKEEWSFDPVRINEIVSKIKQEYKARFDTAEIAGRVQKQLERFAKEKDNEEICDDVFRELSKIGTEVAEAHNIADRTLYEEFKDLRTKLRTTKFSLSQEDRSSIPDYGAFRRKYAFRLGISQNAERGADSVYMELSEEYPQFFPDNITHPADQVQKMAEVIELLKPKVLDINTEDAGKAIAAEIIGTMTADDNYRFEQVTIERVKAEYKEKAKELRKEYTSALDEYRKERTDRENMEKLIKLAKKAQSLRTTEDVLAKFPDMIFELDTMGISILEKGFTKKDGTKVLGRTDLEALKKEYLAEMAKDPNYQPDNDYIMAKIGRLDKKQIADLTPELVQELIELTQEAFHKIRTENKLINDAKRREIYNAGIETIDEVRKGSKWKGQNKFKDFDLIHLTPMEFAKTITGYAKNSTFTYLMKELADGERKKSEFKMRSTRFFDAFVKNEDFKKISGEDAEIDTVNIAGHSVKITPAIRISLYLHSKNKANMRHITKGGVTFPDIELLRKGKLQETFGAAPILLTKEDVKKITNGMSSFEIQFAEKVSQWLNGMCKDEINKTSVELLGYEAARVTNYMPIETNKNFTAIDLLNVDKTLEGAGGLKERTGAANPIMLTDIVTVIQRQMDFVGNYSGLAIPVRNFNKVYNVTQKGHTEKGESVSVKQEVENYWGVAGKKYIDNMLADLQGARKTQSNIFSKFRSNYAGAVLTLNVKSFLKQTSGYVQAADTLGFKAIGKGVFEKLPDRSVIEKYTPLLWMREQGYSIRELGDYAEGQQSLEKKMPWLMSWLQKADIWTAEFIWRASESYVKDNTELEAESDVYYKEVAKMFNKAIEETQPNYTVMQQADIMRSTSEVMKTLTMFQTQARQNYNIMHSAIGEMRAAKRSGDKDWIGEAGKRLGRTVSSQITASAVAAIMGFVGDLILRREDLWKDDEEKLTAKSVSLKAFEETFTGIISSVFLGQEAYELAASLIHGDKWYGLDTSNTELVNDFITAFINVINTAKGEENKDFRAYVMPVLNLTVKGAKMAGVPAENAKKLVTAMFKTALDGAKKLGISTEWIEYHKMQISTPLSQKSTYGNFLKDVLEKAIIETDEEKKKQFYETAKDMSEDMKKKGIEAEYIDKCIKDVARKAYNEKGLESGVTFGSIPWQKVMKGWDWSLENRFYKNVIDSELEKLKDVESIEFSDKGLESLTTMTVSYDGVEYELGKNLARKYETAINDRRVEYYSNVVEKDMDINTVFYGTFKRGKKTSESTDNRISDYLDYLTSVGEITEQERSSRWAQYKAGNLEVPKVDIYTIEYITYDEMGRSQREAEIDEMKKALKKKTITKTEYDTWYRDFVGNRIKINKRKYIYGKYSGLDDATKEKVIAKIMDKATSEVQEEMKKEIIAGAR